MVDIVGTPDDETLVGTNGLDTIEGLGGDDRIVGRDGADLLDGGPGDDDVLGGRGDDVLLGGAGDDDLRSGRGDDLIRGGADDDELRGGRGDDTLEGDEGSDFLIGGRGDDVLRGGQGEDQLRGGRGDDGIDGGDGDDDLRGGRGDDELIGGQGDDELRGDRGDDDLRGGEGDDELDGGRDDDVLQGGRGDDELDGGDGTDAADFSDSEVGVSADLAAGQAEAATGFTLTVDDGPFADLSGTNPAAADLLQSLIDGNGYINVHTSSFPGGEVRGQFAVDPATVGQQIVRFTANLDGGQEVPPAATPAIGTGELLVDTSNGNYDFSVTVDNLDPGTLIDVGGSPVHVHLAPAGQNGPIALNAGLDSADGPIAAIEQDSLEDIENLNGSESGDTLAGDGGPNQLSGNGGDDILIGRGGADTLLGGEGNDLLQGGGGSDVTDGGAGSDTASFADIGSPVTASTGGGNGIATYQGPNGTVTDTLLSIENLEGSENGDTLSGDSGSNELSGLGGDDLLIGGGGADTLLGGEGNDTIRAGGGQDVTDGGAGIDTADFADIGAPVVADLGQGIASYQPAPGVTVVEQLTNFENLTGSANEDQLFGNGGSNVLDGGAGDDLLAGRGGADTLLGGEGNDLLRGGGGDDVTDGGDGIDTADFTDIGSAVTASLEAGTATYQGPNGGVTDTLQNIENLTGSQNDDVLTGDEGDNLLAGAGGADTLIGGGGDDVLRGDEIGAGTTLTVTVENLLGEGGTFLTPVWFGFHDGDDFDLFNGGEAASTGLERLAEDGVVQPISAEFVAQTGEGGVDATLFGAAGAIAPGETVTGLINVTNAQGESFFTWATMVIPSNDAFLAADDDPRAVRLFDEDGNFLGPVEIIRVGSDVLDAGTEVNSEEGSAFLNQTALDQGTPEGSTVGDHPGFNGAAGNPGATPVNILAGLNGPNAITAAGTEIDPAVADFTLDPGNELLRITIDQLSAQGGNDQLEGGAGNDIIEGGGGDDLLDGGSGADSLDGGSGDDLIVSDALDVIDGGSGIDTADFSNAAENATGGAFNGVIVDLDVNSAGAAGTPSQEGAILDAPPAAGGAPILEVDDVENLVGSDFNDGLFGNNEVNVLEGGAGDDVIHGFAGDDFLSGGAGTDTVLFSAAPAGVTVDLNDQVSEADFDDIVAGDAPAVFAASGGAGSNVLAGFENVTGSQSGDTITGDDADNLLNGNGGDDTLEGGAGDDLIDGGSGIDTALLTGLLADFDVQSNGAQIVVTDLRLDSPDGTDTLTNVEFLQFADGQQVDLVNGGGLLLVGDEGNDTLTGAGDDDTLLGNGGDDSLIGNGGDDTLEGNAGNDVLQGGGGNDTTNGGEGRDTASFADINAPVTASLPDGTATYQGPNGEIVDTLQEIENLLGSDSGDSLTGDDGINELSGAGGNDTLAGGGDDDQLYGGSGADDLEGGDGDDLLQGGGGSDVTDGGAGNDTASFADIGSDVTADLEDGEASYQGPNGEVTDTLISIENLNGSDNDDILNGDDGDNILAGGLGDDSLRGRSGGDDLQGGDGVDVLRGNRGADRLSGGGGDDELRGGRGSDRLDGGSGDDELRGGRGSDILDGGAGDDQLIGGRGADTFVLQEGGPGETLAFGDLIGDFQNGSDQIGLAGGLEFSDLTIAADGGDAIISVTGSGEVLAVVTDLAGGIDQTDFSIVVTA